MSCDGATAITWPRYRITKLELIIRGPSPDLVVFSKYSRYTSIITSGILSIVGERERLHVHLVMVCT